MLKEELLKLLRESQDYLSGEELSRRFGVSRSAVWKNINLLREAGYKIESITHRGYRLVSPPDALTAEEISNGLGTQEIGRHIFSFEQIDSTNEEAKRQGQQGVPHGSVFTAEQQLSGKGRLGRVWLTPFGVNIAFSILLRTEDSPTQISNITLLSGLAVCRAVRNRTGCDAAIKWPNDVVVGGKKICGILTEMSAEMERIHYIVTGIGINVNAKDFPPELREKATSLAIETGGFVPRVPLLQECLREFERLYEKYHSEWETALLPEYKRNCVSLGRTVSTVRGGVTLQGTAVDVTPAGELLILTESGEKIAVNSGEVSVQGLYGQ